MDIFKEIKKSVKIEDVCSLLGIKLDRSHKSLCPFPNHKEKTPSFSVSPSKNIFFCFGCGLGGDSITLVSKLLNIKPLEAAKFINERLGLGIEANGKIKKGYVNKYYEEKRVMEEFYKWENKTFQALCDYLHFLEKKYEEEKDKITSIDDFFDNEYIKEYLQQEEKINYYIDIFIYGTDEDKLWFQKTHRKVGEILDRRRIESRNS